MKKLKYICYTLLSLGFITALAAFIAFPNASRLIVCLVSRTLPDTDHIVRIRGDLLGQPRFIKLLSTHERQAVQGFDITGQPVLIKKYIHKTQTSMFDIPSFHDHWEVWVRTDVIEGRPLTSFLVRLGLIKDTNAESYFSNQCESDFCASLMRLVIRTYNKMYDWGVFKPIRLNITESDETSSVSRTRIDLKTWNDRTAKIHGEGKGMGFIGKR